VAVAGAIALAGCGNARTPVPSSAVPAMPTGFHRIPFIKHGIALQVPRNWALAGGRAPLVATITSGNAEIALWRFNRTTPAGAGSGSGRATLVRKLVGESRTRDPSLRVIHTVRTVIQGTPAIELDALERIGGQLRRVRSIHMFVPHAELVLEEYAPPALFHDVNRAVFSPVRRSLGPIQAAA
jgi:hypothetical protein